MYTFKVFSVVLLLLLNFCNTARADLQGDIKARQTELGQLYKAGNVEAAGEFYDENAVFMVTGKQPLKGRTAIKEYFSTDQGRGGTPIIVVTTEEVNGDDNWAFERGSFQVTWKDSEKNGNGVYLVVWKKNENWVIYADSTNYIKLP